MRKIFAVVAALAAAGASADEVTVVTTDTVPGKTCTVAYHLPAVAQQDVARASFNDPTQVAVLDALKALTQIAAKLDANAILGLTVDFTPRTERDTGKVVLTGTLARCE